jgi:hypothetical protein
VALTKAYLIARNTLDGTEFIWEHVPLGKVYWVDLESMKEMVCGNTNQPGLLKKRLVVYFWDNPKGRGEKGWMPVELLGWEKN